MKKEGENYELDNTDLGILNILMKDAKTPYTIIGEKLFVSAGT
ncbi:MAG: Lrp/AsnC family transcriptional regulator for asnA, asnC and gidA, partial [Sphingobacteriales bacterium]